MKLATLIALVLLFCCGKPREKKQVGHPLTSAERPELEDNIIRCNGIGKILLTDQFSAVVEKVGADSMKHDSLMLEGMFEAMVTRLWPASPKEIVVHWKEKLPPFHNVRMLEVSHPGSIYRFSNGIRVGTSLKKIEELNGGTPLKLYGFGWDYGGTFIDFNAGSLQHQVPCFHGVFRLENPGNLDKNLKAVMGDREVQSDAKAFDHNSVVLQTIRISGQ